MRSNLLALAAMTLMLVPAAAAQEDAKTCPDGYVDSPEGCSRQAWVDDCPPDMLCAAGADEPVQYGNESCIECSGIADPEPIHYGDDGCIDCSGVTDDAPDGRGPVDCEFCRGEDLEASGADAARKDAPALGGPLLLAGLAGALFVLRRK